VRQRRRHHVPPDLTSLFDVLFIVIFAALIRAAAVEQAAAKPPPPHPPPPKLAPSALHAEAVTELGKRPFAIARVSAAGVLTALEVDGKVTKLDTPLTEQSADPDVALAYLGERSAEQRICRLVALHLGAELGQRLVIVAPDQHLADLPHALYEGLRHDVERCSGLAVLVEPGGTP